MRLPYDAFPEYTSNTEYIFEFVFDLTSRSDYTTDPAFKSGADNERQYLKLLKAESGPSQRACHFKR